MAWKRSVNRSLNDYFLLWRQSKILLCWQSKILRFVKSKCTVRNRTHKIVAISVYILFPLSEGYIKSKTIPQFEHETFQSRVINKLMQIMRHFTYQHFTWASDRLSMSATWLLSDNVRYFWHRNFDSRNASCERENAVRRRRWKRHRRLRHKWGFFTVLVFSTSSVKPKRSLIRNDFFPFIVLVVH